MSWLGLPVDFMAVDTPEELDSPLAAQPEILASHLAAEKARAARVGRASEAFRGGATDLCASADADVCVRMIAAFDTIVVLDGAVLGKPRDLADAWRMLRALSGRTHQVITGVALLEPRADEPRTISVSTNVRMKPLSDCQIEAWMASGEFMGCAGAYNIEAQVAEVDTDECFQNVAGLPLCHLARELARIADECGLGEMAAPTTPCDAALGRHCILGPRILGDGGDSAG